MQESNVWYSLSYDTLVILNYTSFDRPGLIYGRCGDSGVPSDNWLVFFDYDLIYIGEL